MFMTLNTKTKCMICHPSILPLHQVVNQRHNTGQRIENGLYKMDSININQPLAVLERSKHLHSSHQTRSTLLRYVVAPQTSKLIPVHCVGASLAILSRDRLRQYLVTWKRLRRRRLRQQCGRWPPAADCRTIYRRQLIYDELASGRRRLIAYNALPPAGL